MERRDAIARIARALGGAVSAPTLLGLLAGCNAGEAQDPFQPRTLSSDQLRQVEALAELIIPETDTPGASAAGVHHFVDQMLTDFYPADERAHFLSGLGRVEALSQSRFGKTFDFTSNDERVEILTLLDHEAFSEDDRPDTADLDVLDPLAPFMRTLKELTVAGYYTSEIGQTVELRSAPFGPFHADVPFEQIGRTWA